MMILSSAGAAGSCGVDTNDEVSGSEMRVMVQDEMNSLRQEIDHSA